MQLDKLSGNLMASEAQRKELQAYVGKLERKVTAGNVKKGSFAVLSATPIKRVEKESLLDALAELQDENTRLHGALRVSQLEIRACEAAWITFSTTLSPCSRDDNNQTGS